MTFDPVESARFWMSRNEAEKSALEARIAGAHQEAHRIARLLREEAGAKQVYLFGSLAEGTVYRAGFDIDLAMVNGDPQAAWRVIHTSPFEIDLQEYETLPLIIRQRIDAHGVQLL